MNPLRIAVFIGEFPVLSETFIVRQIVGLVRSGHTVTVITGELTGIECDADFNDIKIIREGANSLIIKILCILHLIFKTALSSNKWKNIRGLAEVIFKRDITTLLDIAAISARPLAQRHLGSYDAIIAHFGPAGVRAMNLKNYGLLAGPLATVFHGFDMSEYALLTRYRRRYLDLFSHANLLLPVSNFWRDRLVSWGAPSDKVQVLRMGVDIEPIEISCLEKPLHTPLRILSVARLTEKKGLRYAITGVIEASVPIHYQIVGAGALEAELKALASKAPEDKKIEFLGKRSHKEVLEKIFQTDIFLLPSVTAAGGDMEGVPVALMEAMAKGTIVIATNHSGIPELIKDEMSGYLVPERDARAIACKINYIAGSMPSALSVRVNAKKTVDENFNNAKLDKDLESICKFMMGSEID